MEEVTLLIEEATEMMQKSIAHLEKELFKITTGKANPIDAFERDR